MANERVFTSAREVWDSFVSRAEIQPKTYDRDLTDALRHSLGIPQSRGAFSADLEKHGISLERFIVALLEVGEPFSMMMSGLCEFLERHRARRSEVMHLRFNFESADASRVSFDIEHFRGWLATWERVRKIVHVHQWTYDALWSLCGIIGRAADELRDGNVVDPSASSWIAISRVPPRDRRVSRGFMPSPSVAELPPDVGACVRIVADLVNDVVGIDSRFNGRSARARSDAPVSPGLSNGSQPSCRFPPAFVRFLETDYFTAKIAEAIWRWSEALRSLSVQQRELKGAQVAAEVRDLLGRLDVVRVDKETLRERLEEVLSLPIWKLRSNLYSAWLLTLVEGAFPDANFTLQAPRGILNLSRSSEVATFNRGNQTFTMMSEHRVSLASPIGDSRVSGAQPDYTFLPTARSDSSEAYAVLEAKQYRRASTGNFREAAIDYANAHIHARIIISDYGPLSDNIAEKIRAAYEARVVAYGDVHPGFPENVRQVQKTLRSALAGALKLSDESQLCFEDVRYIAIDVSGSMLEALRAPEVVFAIRELIAVHPEAEIIAVDNDLRLCESGAGALERVLACEKSGGTDLQYALRGIPFAQLLVITDGEGASQVESADGKALGVATVDDGRLLWRGRRSKDGLS